MKVEFKSFLIPIDQNMQAAVKALEDEGWQVRSDVPPVAIWHLQRTEGAKPAAGMGSTGKMSIDESKIWVQSPPTKPQ